MKNIKIIFVFVVILFVQASFAEAQSGGVIFKIPDDVFPMDWNKSGFKGFLMLRKDSPSGVFIAYPNDNENLEDLKARAVKFIAPMVIKDDNGGADFKLEKKSILKREGDSSDAFYHSYANKALMVQVIVYERVINEKPFIYGYFAAKDKDADPKKIKIWADEKGQGVKIFEKFWKSIKG